MFSISEMDEYLATLKKGESKIKSRSLDILHSVLKDHYLDETFDFNLINIAQKSQERDGVGLSSLKNKSGLKYKSLIEKWGILRRQVLKEPTDVDISLEVLIADKIHDPVLKSALRVYFRKYDDLKNENNILKSKKDGKPPYLLDMDLYQEKFIGISSKKRILELNTSELNALKDAVNINDNLARKGWHIDQFGAVWDDKNQMIFKVGFKQAIDKILFFLNK